MTDHKVPHRLSQARESGDQQAMVGAQALFWDTANWQALCWECHSTKTATEDGGFGHPRLRRTT